MREIKAGDKYNSNDLEFLEHVSIKDVKSGDTVICKCNEHVEYVQFSCLETYSHRRCVGNGQYKRILRVPRPDEKTSEPEVGKVVDTRLCKIGWIIKMDSSSRDGRWEAVIRNDNEYIETKSWLSSHGDMEYVLISKGDEEILEAACSSGEPEVGDIVKGSDCKVGWTFEYVDTHSLAGKKRIVVEVDSDGYCLIENPSTGDCLGDIKSTLVKLVSKGSPQPGDIVELRNCQVGWTVEFIKETLDVGKYAGRQKRIKEIRYNGEEVWFEFKTFLDGWRKVKLISKGDEPDPTFIPADLCKGVITANEVRAQESMSTQEWQEIMGWPVEVVEEVLEENSVRSKGSMTFPYFDTERFKVGDYLKIADTHESRVIQISKITKGDEKTRVDYSYVSAEENVKAKTTFPLTQIPKDPNKLSRSDIIKEIQKREVVREQDFIVPPEFMDEVFSKVSGMPSDTKYCGSEDDRFSLRSMEFMAHAKKLKIILDGDGWKVEGT